MCHKVHHPHAQANFAPPPFVPTDVASPLTSGCAQPPPPSFGCAAPAPILPPPSACGCPQAFIPPPTCGCGNPPQGQGLVTNPDGSVTTAGGYRIVAEGKDAAWDI